MCRLCLLFQSSVTMLFSRMEDFMQTSNTETSNPLVALSRLMTEAVEHVSPSIVAIDARPRVRTSGVIWRPDVIVSTNHTIRRHEEITVALHDGQQIKATVSGRDTRTRLAVLRIEASAGATTAAKFADASTLKVGNLVLAAGRIDPKRGVSAGLGIVAFLGDKWRTWRGGEIDRLITTDISIFIGYSAGALLNTEGQVLGISTTRLSRGAGLTIPASTANRIVDHLLQYGRVAPPYPRV